MSYELREEYAELIKDEVNVKNVEFVKSDELSVDLDVELTPELIMEGRKREIVRNINGLRKKQDLTIGDNINIIYSGNDDIKKVMEDYSSEIKNETLANVIIFKNIEDAKEFSINGETAKISIEKI